MKSNAMFIWLFFYMRMLGSEDSFDTKTIAAKYNRTKTVKCYCHNPYVLRCGRKNNRPIPTYTKTWKKVIAQD